MFTPNFILYYTINTQPYYLLIRSCVFTICLSLYCFNFNKSKINSKIKDTEINPPTILNPKTKEKSENNTHIQSTVFAANSTPLFLDIKKIINSKKKIQVRIAVIKGENLAYPQGNKSKYEYKDFLIPIVPSMFLYAKLHTTP